MVNDISGLIRATLSLYSDCLVEATRGLRKNWVILLASVAAFLAFSFISSLLMPFGMAGGMLLGLVEIAFLTLYYSWLSETTRKQKVSWANLLEFDMGLFFALISVSFLIWILEWVVASLVQGAQLEWVQAFVRLGLVILINAVPEVLYIHRNESFYALQQAARFTRENWIEWYFPFVVVIMPWILSGPDMVPLLLSQAHPLLPVMIVFTAPFHVLPPGQSFIAALIGVLLANWFMVFRGFLFLGLEGGSRRKRIFDSKR